ncbi:MAG: Dna2/Cas4 domain-containing protein [Candidatus Aenigmarchaeota archaeon]|nr:Dna2/Cas4 domain-containing protein [Candidatus Aenigmarchaeota archaeon]
MIDFNRMIDNHIRKEHRPKGIGRYYPSEIGTCMRKIWYSYKYPMEVKPDLLKIFEVGNILHDFVVNVLKSEKNPDVELLKSEFSFQEGVDDFVVSGRVDNLILVKMTGKSVLVEVKSTSEIGYVDEPSDSHEMQLQYYMHITGVHNGILLYIDKKNLQSKIFEVAYDGEKSKEISDRFKTLHKNLTADEMPEPESRRSGEKKIWMCRYCEYHERCYQATPRSSEWL